MVGNTPNFTKIDILRCFLKFHDNVSRQQLAKELSLGEGTVRTILSILKSKRLLESTKKGHFLSRAGAKALNEILERISVPKRVSIENLYPEFNKMGVVVKGVKELGSLYKIRDIAVRSGADGAVILKYDGKLLAPESDTSYRGLEKDFNFKSNDVLVVAFSSEIKLAESGALAIAIELNEPLKKFVVQF